MKFITSTHLKQWADTKESQALLPELIRRLICASVKQLDRLTFPCGDAGHMPGWDGIVSCREQIDLVPEGESLWECGVNKDIQTKANDDITKRAANPLGHIRAESTFVFVTPREWAGANAWILANQTGWKKLVVYTAVELEVWIEKCPAVGLWLADKLNILIAGGYQLPDVFWKKWASGDKYTLPYQIVTAGRNQAIDCVLKACFNPSVFEIQALTQSEAVAFVLASIATCSDADKLLARAIVVTDKNTFDDLVSHYENLIIITTLRENMSYALSRNHTVICAVTPEDQVSTAEKLPRVEREGFVKAIEDCGFDYVQAGKIATDTARDVNVVRRRLKIDKLKPEWANRDGISALLPVALLGQWNENVPGDLKLVEKLCGKTYPDYVKILQGFILMSDSPIAHVGAIWRLKSPMDTMSYASAYLTSDDLANLKEICALLIGDDDPDAEEKLVSDEWKMWQFRQQFSSDVKKGTYQSLILLSLINDESNSRSVWIDDLVRELLNGWTLKRFLSNRSYFTLLAEASPEAFLEFLEEIEKDIYDVVFTPQKSSIGVIGWNIYYTEILWTLEMLAWDDDYIYRATSLLLRFSTYKNESNYANKPTNSLAEIFRFQWPQTFASFDNRIQVLISLSSSFKSEICKLCFRILESLGPRMFSQTHFYKWRHFSDLSSPKCISVPVDNLKAITKLLLGCTTFSEDDICKLLKLSTNKWMICCRTDILNAIIERKDNICESDIIEHTLREELTRHLSIPEAAWALSEKELEPYKKLLSDIEPKNVVMKHRWMFEDMFLRLPQKIETDLEKDYRMKQEIRDKAVKEILSERGREGIWELISVVKCHSSVVNSMILLYGDGLLRDTCERFGKNIVDIAFLQEFFRRLFFQKGEDDYMRIIEDVKVYGNTTCLSVCLYAPEYNEKLAAIANDCGEDIETLYWQNISVVYVKIPNPMQIIDKLIWVDRFDKALELIYHNKNSSLIPDIIKVNVIKGLMFRGHQDFTPHIDWFYIDNVIEDLDKSEDPEIIQTLVQIEFFAYRAFADRRNINDLRFIKELMSKPELLIELIMMVYKSDDGNEEEVSESEQNNKKVMARCASSILYDLSCCPGVDEQGNVNPDVLRSYIYRLYELSVERHRTQVVDMVVGTLLGNLPRNVSYPQAILGEIVEELKSDSVDEHIRIRIFNSRGVTVRGFAEGGDQERSLAALFRSYRDKVKFTYPRLTKIFTKLMNDYERGANREDCVAQLEDLEY